MLKLGKAFSDNVEKVRHRRVEHGSQRIIGWGARITLFYLLLILGFFLLGVRLFHLTLVRGNEYRKLAQENRIRNSTIHAPRGIFFDRRSVPLVENIPGYRLTGPCPETATLNKEALPAGNKCAKKFFTQNELARVNISPDYYLLEKDYFRKYLEPYVTTHVLGYLTEINGEELTNPFYAYQGYQAGDRMGRMGLEETLEKNLRGVDGRELIEVDAQGKKVRTLGQVEPVPGQNFTLTIDADLQKQAFMALGENSGGVVVTRPKSGEVLALVSTPGFDANRFHLGLSQGEYLKLVESPDKPLLNRVIAGVYPPGSTFKIIAAVGALAEKKIDKNTVFEDTGVLTVGNFSFGNWYYRQYGKKEGMVDVLKAIARSNDIFFYKLGEALGIEAMASWGKKFGLGKKTGIELSGEAEGLMPDPIWRQKLTGQKWYLGDTYNVGIGQGDMLTTPLQVNLWTNAIAGGGILCKPTLIKSQNPNLNDQNCRDLSIKKETIDLVTEGMRRACYRGDDIAYQGTGWPFFDFTVVKETLSEGGGKAVRQTVPVACKTGTAETSDKTDKTHAWFTAFAPLPAEALAKAGTITNVPTITGEPEIVVTVLVELGGEGSSVAGPIAKKIMEEWFKR